MLEDLEYRKAWKLTYFTDEKNVVRVTRVLYNGKPARNRQEYVVSICKPNYRERMHIKRKGIENDLVLMPPKKSGKK